MKKKIAVVLMVLMVIGVIYNNSDISIESYTVTSNVIRDQQKVAIISDFLNGRNGKQIAQTLKQLDLTAILIVGDFIKSDTKYSEIDFTVVDDLVKIAPVLYVTGENEWRNDEFPRIMETFTDRGVVYLDNQSYLVDNVAYVGIEDPEGPNLPAVYQEITKDVNADYYVLLAHKPQHFEIYKTWKVNVVLAGDTFGGLIELPYIGGIFAEGQGMFPKFTSGVYDEQGSKMIISRGTGSEMLPFRVFNRSEIVVLTIKRGW